MLRSKLKNRQLKRSKKLRAFKLKLRNKRGGKSPDNPSKGKLGRSTPTIKKRVAIPEVLTFILNVKRF